MQNNKRARKGVEEQRQEACAELPNEKLPRSNGRERETRIRRLKKAKKLQRAEQCNGGLLLLL